MKIALVITAFGWISMTLLWWRGQRRIEGLIALVIVCKTTLQIAGDALREQLRAASNSQSSSVAVNTPTDSADPTSTEL
jgi:hypothetical protein